MHASARTIPLRTLLGLTAAVVLAHLLVVRNIPLGPGGSEVLATRVFTTRSLQINPPAAAAPVPATPRPAPVAATPPPPPARKAAQTTPANEAAMAAATVVAAAGTPTPAEPTPPPVQAQAPVVPASAPAAPEPVVAATSAVPANAPPVTPVPAALPRDTAVPARAYTVPGSTRLKFDATGLRGRFTYQALGELLWQHDGDNYQARLEAGDWIIGAVVSTSLGRITADGLAPKTFSEGPRGKSPLAAHFERDRGRIVFSANTPEVPLEPGAQDRLSIFVQLASLLAGEPARYPPGTRVEVQTVTRRAAETWAFSVEKQEKLSLPGGDQDTLHLVRMPRKEFDQKIEVWLAPALSYLPARILITDANGNFLDLKWRATAAP